MYKYISLLFFLIPFTSYNLAFWFNYNTKMNPIHWTLLLLAGLLFAIISMNKKEQKLLSYTSLMLNTLGLLFLFIIFVVMTFFWNTP
ncbi:hypothetical protein [Longirhabdus pacifica]|uniref:hypothetical protein n=1 Tax=Longirhabdus pacifica TaxID=2305227 RepID=UPI0010088818|nr:hypothetical protein [Longirhabdus pacifica]